MKKVGIVAGSISRFDNPRHTLQEEMCAEAVKMILNDALDLELGDFIRNRYAYCHWYFSDILRQHLYMHWIINDYLGQSGAPPYQTESGDSTPLDAVVNAALWVCSNMFPVTLVIEDGKMSEMLSSGKPTECFS